MTDRKHLERRLAAVERALLEADRSFDDLSSVAALETTAEDLEERLEEQERRVAALEAADRSLQGYVDHLEHVNEEVERQANAALAAVDRVDRRLALLEESASFEHAETAVGGVCIDSETEGGSQPERQSDEQSVAPPASAPTDPETTAAAVLGETMDTGVEMVKQDSKGTGRTVSQGALEERYETQRGGRDERDRGAGDTGLISWLRTRVG